MKKVLHLSTECYPAAKAGGMADVVGALPLYQAKHHWAASVIIPRYDLDWFGDKEFEVIYSDILYMNIETYNYTVLKYANPSMGYEFYCIDMPSLMMRKSIYLDQDGHGYRDEGERNLAFQRAVLQWLAASEQSFDLLHCHDHQTGFIPFMIKSCPDYAQLSQTPTFYTIHNGAYNSRYTWDQKSLFPSFDESLTSTIDWDDHIDAVAAAIKYADHINAVSPTYLLELLESMGPLKNMYSEKPDKLSGILNGIDDQVWNPKTDSQLPHRLGRSWDIFKKKNKVALLHTLYRAEDVPLISFIGRFAHQKGADLLRPAIEYALTRFGFVNFFIMGSGDRYLEHMVQGLRDRYPDRVGCYIGYNEGVAHRVYAASDFLLMPSRFEPCGLNQMIAMRYGTLPIVRATGGLKDTVTDFVAGGIGIALVEDSADELSQAISRALYLIKDQALYQELRKKAIAMNYTWHASALTYTSIYNQLIKRS